MLKKQAFSAVSKYFDPQGKQCNSLPVFTFDSFLCRDCGMQVPLCELLTHYTKFYSHRDMLKKQAFSAVWKYFDPQGKQCNSLPVFTFDSFLCRDCGMQVPLCELLTHYTKFYSHRDMLKKQAFSAVWKYFDPQGKQCNSLPVFTFDSFLCRDCGMQVA